MWVGQGSLKKESEEGQRLAARGSRGEVSDAVCLGDKVLEGSACYS